METGERNYAWYNFDGKDGILAYPDCPKLQGIIPIAEGDNMNFYTFESLNGIEITAEDVCCVLSDSYSNDCTDKGGTIGEHCVVNPENEQHVINAWEYDAVYEDDLAKRELATYTDRFYNWTSKLTEFTDSAVSGNLKFNTKEELGHEWKEICKNYTFHYSEPLDFEVIWNRILEKREENEENS